MLGTWRYKDESVTLNDDGSFLASDQLRGTWSIKGAFFDAESIPPDKWKRPLAVIRDNGRIVLLKPHDQVGDPDSWDRRHAFVKDAR